MFYLILFLQLCFLVQLGAHNFQGNSINDKVWKQNIERVNCFARNSSWVPHKHGLTTLRSIPHCRSTPYSKANCAASKGNRYDWYSGNKCDSPKHYFSAERMCELMKGTAIGFVGDSMQEVLAHSFMTDLYGSSGFTDCWVCQIACFGWYHFNCDLLSHLHNEKYKGQDGFVPVHWPNFTIIQVRNDKLYVGGRTYPGYNAARFLQDWTKQFHNPWFNISVIVFNRGAHYEANDTEFIDDVNLAFSYVNTHFPNTTVLYRATAVGHADIDKLFYSSPLTIPQPFNMTNPEFHYADFQRQNELVQNLIDKRFPNYIYLDVYPMSILRADSHRDPLHYCIPGPTSAWSDLLFQTLHMFNSPENSKIKLHEYEVSLDAK